MRSGEKSFDHYLSEKPEAVVEDTPPITSITADLGAFPKDGSFGDEFGYGFKLLEHGFEYAWHRLVMVLSGKSILGILETFHLL